MGVDEMTKNERNTFLITGVIFAVIMGILLKAKVLDMVQVIQITISFILVLITTIYVKRTSDIASATQEQAKASIKMAEEMREQRYDTVRPVIDIVTMELSPRELFKLAYAAKEGKLPKDLPCKLRNVGVGPAIELYSFIEDVEDTKGNPRRWDFGTLPVATGKEEWGYTREMRLLLMQRGNQMALVAYYKDVYGNPFESSREVRVGAVNPDPLQIREITEEELPK